MTAVNYKDIARTITEQMRRKTITAIAEGLAAYLVSERRANDLGKIMREVERIRYVEQGILEVQVSSAREITEGIEAQVKELFTAEDVMINKTKDADLVGGVKIQAQDTLIDLSVRGQLNKLKAHKF